MPKIVLKSQDLTAPYNKKLHLSCTYLVQDVSCAIVEQAGNGLIYMTGPP